MPIDPSLPDSDPVTDTAAADQTAAQLASPHGHAHGPIHTHCENCGTALQGPFCHKCGQHDFEFHRSFGHVFLEALENFLHFDAKFFRNIVTLLFRPGQLTADFNAGKRASQMPPFRLYLFTAFAFFLLLFANTDKEADAVDTGPGKRKTSGIHVEGRPATLDQALGAIAEENAPSTPAEPAVREPNRPHLSVVKSEQPDAEKSGFERFLEHQSERALEPEFRRHLGHAFLAAMPKLLLFCLPLFALYTRVLFRKSGQVYLQHLVLAIHFHTFIYLWVMFRDGWVFLGQFAHIGGLISFAANLWLTLYPFFMLRRLYANSWGLTIFKTGLLAALYTFTLAVGFFVTAIVLFLVL